ncbi:MAG: ATP-binding cassette domain-containing protein, partial [Pseudomonadota bacterium]
LSSDQARTAGLGRMIATTIDASRLDVLAINGGTATALATAEVAVLLAVVVAMQAWPLVLLLLASLLALAAMALRYYQLHQRWHEASLAVTALHTEEMVGHRARKMLLGMEHWYDAQAQELARYNAASRASDHIFLLLKVAPRVWLLVGAAAVLLSAYLVEGFSETGLIAQIGILLLGSSALKRVAQGLREAIDATISYRHLAKAVHLDGAHTTLRPHSRRDPFTQEKAPELVVSDLRFSYAGAAQAPIDGLNLRLRSRERATLEGASGTGKSTLARILTGRLAPSHGSVMLGGLDQQVLGSDGWRRQVRYVPQYNNNHVLTETLLFNLLLGSDWPPAPGDLVRVEQVVDAVGLRPLVEAMPAGLQQMVGEGGWRLSQGEQARLFLARGMLQSARLLILDEPLSALDPHSALEVMDALEALDRSLMVITHR